MRVRFLRNFNWHVPEFKGHVTIAYKARTTETVKQACADEAIAKGAAEKVESRKAQQASDDHSRPAS